MKKTALFFVLLFVLYSFSGCFNNKAEKLSTKNEKVSEVVTTLSEESKPEYSSKEYTLTLDPKGGSFDAPTEYIAHAGEPMTEIFGDLPKPEKEGYVFVCWYNRKFEYVLRLRKDELFTICEDAPFEAVYVLKW